MDGIYRKLFKLYVIFSGFIHSNKDNSFYTRFEAEKAYNNEFNNQSLSLYQKGRTKGNGKGKRGRSIIFSLLIVCLCFVISSAQPLRVAASESDSAIPESVAVIAGALAGGCATYCASAALGLGAAVVAGAPLITIVGGVIVVVLVGLGVSLAVGGIVTAINKAYEFGYFQEFVDKIVAGLNGGFISYTGKKIVMGASFFSYAYDWVKEHIVGYFNKNIPSTNLENAVDGFEVLVPSYHFDHKPTNDEVINHVYPDTNNLYGRISWVYSDIEGQGGAILEKSAGYVLKSNPNTNINYQLGSSMWFKNVVAATRHLYNYIVLTDDIKFSIETYFYSGEVLAAKDKSSTYYFCVPFVYEENNVRKLFVANYSSLTTNGATSDLTLRSHLNLAGTNKHYYLNDDELKIANKVVYTYNGNQNLSLVYQDGTLRNTFSDIQEFLYYACCTSCDIQFIDRSSAEVSDIKSNTNITYTTVNNYYNEKKDILKNTADTVRTGVKNGTITDTAEGTIGLTITDTATAEAGEVSDTSVITDTAAITDVTATDVVVNGEVVIPSPSVVPISTVLKAGSNNINIALQSGGQRFPFSSYRNVYNYLQNITGISAEAPVIPINIKYMDIDYHDEIDFSFMTNYIKVIHAGLLISYVIGLYMVVRNFIIKKELGG